MASTTLSFPVSKMHKNKSKAVAKVTPGMTEDQINDTMAQQWIDYHGCHYALNYLLHMKEREQRKIKSFRSKCAIRSHHQLSDMYNRVLAKANKMLEA